MIEIREVGSDEFFDSPGFKEIFEDYTQECGNPVIGKTEPNREIYRGLYVKGMLRCGCAEIEGKAVGGVYVTIYEVPHYKGSRVASIESIFLKKEFRKGTTGLNLIRWAKKIAKECGCSMLFINAPKGSTLEKIGRRRWDPIYTTFGVEIG